MKSGIYKLFWADKGYFYFGQAQELSKRRSIHLSRMKKGTHENNRIQNVFNKYGIPEFQIIEMCEIELLDQREQFFLNIHFSNRMCCNLSPTASSSRGIKRSELIKEKLRILKTDSVLSSEHKNNISLGLTEAYKNGRKKPDLNGSKNSFFERKHSEESKLNMSESKKKLGLMKNENNPKAKIVLNTQNGIFYLCIKEAAESFGFNLNKLSRMLTGKRKNKTPFIYAQ